MAAAPIIGNYVDVAYMYTYEVTLTANQSLLNQQVPIIVTADFVWRGLVFPLFNQGLSGLPLQPFNVMFYNGNGRALSTDFMAAENLVAFPGNSFPYFPEVWYPAGGRIRVDIQDTSGVQNSIQLLFIGSSRYAAEL